MFVKFVRKINNMIEVNGNHTFENESDKNISKSILKNIYMLSSYCVI